MNATIYVSDEEIWNESKRLAQSYGISHSALIMRALHQYCDNEYRKHYRIMVESLIKSGYTADQANQIAREILIRG